MRSGLTLAAGDYPRVRCRRRLRWSNQHGRSFEELVAEAAAVPIDGWDFSRLEGRPTEVRPSWHYSGVVADRVGRAGKLSIYGPAERSC
jgi:hypothetical protein